MNVVLPCSLDFSGYADRSLQQLLPLHLLCSVVPQNFIFFAAWFLETFWIYIVWAAAKHHAREVCPGA
jgi:hypothetical protein